MTADEKYTQMTQAPVEKLICKLAVPTICSMLITSLYNMADTFFVSKINPSATGAVGVVFSLMAIIQAVGFFFGQGSGSYISRQLGIHNTQEAEKMVSFGFFTSFFSGFLIMIPGLIFIKQLAIVLGSTPTILPYSIDYLGIILLATPYMTSSLVLNNQLRFQGNAFYAMIGLCSGGILNIVLDPIFIFIFNMGIKGAALATTLSQFVSFCLLIIGTFKSDSINIKISKYPLKFYYFSEVCASGFPSLSRQGIASVATICLNILAGRYGDVAVAAMSIVSRVAMFANSAMIGFGQGFQPNAYDIIAFPQPVPCIDLIGISVEHGEDPAILAKDQDLIVFRLFFHVVVCKGCGILREGFLPKASAAIFLRTVQIRRFHTAPHASALKSICFTSYFLAYPTGL